MKAVILAAGKGTRMTGLCDELPKPLLPVVNRPILAHTIAQLESAGVDDALVVIGHQAQMMRSVLGDRRGNVRLHYIEQTDPKGTGQAAALAETFVDGEPFIMLFGDIVTSRHEVPEIVEVYTEEKPAAILSVRYFRDPASGGAVYLEGNRVDRIVERPKRGAPKTHYINAGIFVFPPQIFDLLRQVDLSPRGEYELTDAIRMLLDAGQVVRAFDLRRFWVNVTDPTAYLEAQRELFGEWEWQIPDVPADVAIRQPAILGHGAQARKGAQIGPNVGIGDLCTIGAGAHVHDAIIMTGAEIGDGAIVEHAVVGMGTRLEHGARLVGDPEGKAAVAHHGNRV